MIQLPDSSKAWGKATFAHILKAELQKLSIDDLQLDKSLSIGSHITDDALEFMILGKVQNENQIEIRLGIFFKSIIAGCSCADDPTPTDTNNEYCERGIAIDLLSSEAHVISLE